MGKLNNIIMIKANWRAFDSADVYRYVFIVYRILFACDSLCTIHIHIYIYLTFRDLQ